MGFLRPQDLTFSLEHDGHLSLRMADGAELDYVKCAPLFPHSGPDENILVVKRVEGKDEEVGIIEELAALDDAQAQLVRDDLSFHYFAPRIIDVAKLDERFGMNEFQVTTDKGERTFYVRNIKENIVIHDDTGMVFINDIQKCRYYIPDYRTLPPRARAKVEAVLL